MKKIVAYLAVDQNYSDKSQLIVFDFFANMKHSLFGADNGYSLFEALMSFSCAGFIRTKFTEAKVVLFPPGLFGTSTSTLKKCKAIGEQTQMYNLVSEKMKQWWDPNMKSGNRVDKHVIWKVDAY
jgi:hypothetical protein